MSKIFDITGNKYNRLIVVSCRGRINNRTYWDCLCDCGKNALVEGDNLKRGKVKSCGCYAKEVLKANNTGRVMPSRKTHGLSSDKLYAVWRSMKARCNNTNNHAYYRYGGRGICVCKRWMGSFENFYNDMYSSYEDGLTLERKDVNGNYCPENCKWATYKEQAKNMRTNKVISYNGETGLLIDFCSNLNISPNVVHRRISAGWDVKRALETPIMESKINFSKRKQKQS